jgi:Flp pilus assembly pilin Flp
MLKLYASLQIMLERLSREEGQTAVEYGLVLALIAVVVVGAVAGGLTAAGGPIDSVMQTITDALP